MKKIAQPFVLNQESTYTSHVVDNTIASITNSAVTSRIQCHDGVNLLHRNLEPFVLRHSNYHKLQIAFHIVLPHPPPPSSVVGTVLRALGNGSQAIPKKIHRQTHGIDFNRQGLLPSAPRICCFPCKIGFVRPASGSGEFWFLREAMVLFFPFLPVNIIVHHERRVGLISIIILELRDN